MVKRYILGLPINPYIYLRIKQHIFSFILFLSCWCHAQTSYITTWYSADSDHLPQNSVKSITPDKYGFIWLATESGLVRFDGENFKLFNMTNVKGIHSDRMYMFAGSPEKDSIIIRNELREFLLVKERCVFTDTIKRKPLFPPNEGYMTDNVQTLPGLHYTVDKEVFRVSSNGITYVIGADSIRRYNNKLVMEESYPHNSPDSTQFFSSGGKLYRMLKSNHYEQLLAGRSIRGEFAVPNSGHSRLYSNEAAGQLFFVSGPNVYFVKETADGFSLSLEYNAFDVADNIRSIYFDTKRNILFMGSHNKGLQVIKKQGFAQMGSPYRMNRGVDGVYYGLAQLDSTRLMASTGSIFRNGKYESGIGINEHSDKYYIIKDKNGDIWVTEFAYVYRYKKSGGYREYDRYEMGERVGVLQEGYDGKIWVGTLFYNKAYELGNLFVIDPDGSPGEFRKAARLDEGPRSLLSLSRTRLLVGTRYGLLDFNPEKNSIKPVSGFEGGYIRNIYRDSEGEIWAASYNKGLYLYRNGKVTNFPPDKNNYMLTANCITEDNNGFLWVTTNRGLFRILKQDLYRYADGKTTSFYFHWYNKSAGFATNEFNGGCNSCGLFMNHETLYLPSMEGIVYFKPDSIGMILPDSDIFIDDAEIDGAMIPANAIDPPRDFNRLVFYISSPYWGNRYNQNIEARLLGPVTQDWAPLTGNYVAFSTLPPGDYTLEVRKLPGFGKDYITKSIKFCVRPAFWQTTWFAVLMIIAGALLIYIFIKLRLSYIRYKNRQLEKQVALRTAQLRDTIATLRKTKDSLGVQVSNHKKLIKTVTHDIKSPLKFMSITGRYIYNNMGSENATLKEDVESVYTSAAQLYHFVDNFLEYMREPDGNGTEQYPLGSLADEKISFFTNLARYKNITLNNTITPDVKVSVNRHLLSIIIHNLMDNAIKNTKSGAVTLSAENTETGTELVITDTGSGIEPEKKAYFMRLFNGEEEDTEAYAGMGMHIIAELALLLDIRTEIVSAPGEGTSVKLLIPKTTIS